MKINQDVLPAIAIGLMVSFAPAPVSAQLGGYVAPAPSAPSAPQKSAPGPLIGGLPGLAIGYGVYWLVKRRRKSTT
jgi:hypothetical protein